MGVKVRCLCLGAGSAHSGGQVVRVASSSPATAHHWHGAPAASCPAPDCLASRIPAELPVTSRPDTKYFCTFENIFA